jgi:hypothetical protein
MIRIRYPDFSSGASDLAGLHGIAEPSARGVTVYLLPGLTGRQRKAVIRRLRQEASRGFGPALPLFWLVIALCVDRLRMAGVTAVAVFRLHPAATLLPGAAAAAMALFVLSCTGGAPGRTPGPGAGLAGALVGNGHPASGVGPAVAVGSAIGGRAGIGGRNGIGGGAGIGGRDGIGLGGSGLGSAVPAAEWRARPHRAHRAHRAHPPEAHRRPEAHRPPPLRYRGQPRYRWRRCHQGFNKLACRWAES